ncbi:MAG: transcriptional regulator, GntR family [Nocardioidaceae bacterium]|nr:transcriptional regulator, GntR family [Nocardioidaceae bacterium]
MNSDTTRPGSGDLPRVGQGSLTERTTHALLEAILDRRFPNDRLPNEPDLAEQMGVSRTTIRAALQSLDRLGVISRVPGRGTQLRPHIGRESMLLHRVIGFRGMLDGLYDHVEVEQTFTVQPRISNLGAVAIGVSPETPTLVNDKTYLVEGAAAVHMVQEVPLSYVNAWDAESLVAGTIAPPPTIFDFSVSWPGREIDHSVVELGPQVAGGVGPEGSVTQVT